MLEHEGPVDSSAEWARAASQVFDKLHAHLDPILGPPGVAAVFARSARLVRGEFPFLELAVRGGAPQLRASLEAQELEVAAASAEALFGTFISLLATFIGERLTTQILRRVWPTLDLDGAPPTETKT